MHFPEPQEMISTSLVEKLGKQDDAADIAIVSLVSSADPTSTVSAAFKGLKRCASGAGPAYELRIVSRCADVVSLVGCVDTSNYASILLEGPISFEVDLGKYRLVSCEVTTRQEPLFCDVVLTFEVNT